MQYLEDLQHYEDRYDLMTIEHCLEHLDLLKGVATKIRDDKKLQHLSAEEKETQMDRFANRAILNLMLYYHKKREKTLEE